MHDYKKVMEEFDCEENAKAFFNDILFLVVFMMFFVLLWVVTPGN